MTIHLRQGMPEDAAVLHELSCRTFRDAFAEQNTPSQLQAYLDRAYNVDKLHRELSNQDSRFYFLYLDGTLAGYLKLNQSSAQTEFQDPEGLEIERIYIAKEFQGKGLGGHLIGKAMEVARQGKKQYVWLGVWEKNKKALSFYQKHGFYPIGSHSFFVGDDRQTDYLMRCDLEKSR